MASRRITAAFPLNSAAGLALLSLAEALLRVPDAANADRLVRDRLSRVDWRRNTAAAAPWAGQRLRLAQRLRAGRPRGWRTLTTPLVRSAMQLAIRALSNQFIFAHSIEAALARAGRAAARAYRYSFDMLGEAALTAHDAQRYFLAYRQAIHAVGGRVPRPGAARRRQRVGEAVGAASTLRLHAARAHHA